MDREQRPKGRRSGGRGAVACCVAALIALCISLFPGCSSDKQTHQTDTDILIQIGDSALRLQEVIMRIPVGLDPADSISLFNNIVDTWIQNLLLRDVAEANITDMSRIDAMVEEYRNQLIVSEYRRRIKEENVKGVPEDSIRAYYKRFGDDMLLEHPLIKGIYIKLPEKAEKIQDVTAWMRSAKPADIDKIENEGLREAMQYDYFGDRWVDWQLIAEQIPYRISDPDAFVESNTFFTTTYNGAVYLLHIFDHINSGNKMPYDFASPLIQDMLNEKQRDSYEERLVNSLYRKALREGKLKKVTFDPVTHQRIAPTPVELRDETSKKD